MPDPGSNESSTQRAVCAGILAGMPGSAGIVAAIMGANPYITLSLLMIGLILVHVALMAARERDRPT